MATFDEDKLRRLPNVSSIEYQPSMPSTSDRAKELLKHGISSRLPLLVIADRQTAGRGQPGKQWFANQDSLTFTWCCNTEWGESTSSLQLLPLASGLAVCESLDQLGIESVTLKWPNDVLVHQHKVAGILVESTKVQGHTVAMIGIGINVNQSNTSRLVEEQLSGPPKRTDRFVPISLAESVGESFELESVLNCVLENLGKQCDRLRLNGTQLVLDLNQRLLLQHKTVTVEQANGTMLVGRCLGIGNEGELLLKSKDGKQRVFSGTVVKFEN